MELSVNIDHVATVREARKEKFPDPAYAAVEAELGGADGITVHLRGDRRHIKERDLAVLKQIIRNDLNLEMAATDEMARIAVGAMPDRVTLVPEAPGEVTTQGGLDLSNVKIDLKSYISDLKGKGIRVGIFIDPDMAQIKAALRVGAESVEINTNEYTQAKNREEETSKISRVAKAARREGLVVHAGHGIDYTNILPLLSIPEITGYSIGFAIVARALFVGLRQAVSEMKEIIKGAR
ncbi:MAG: pyridoxine 5'-phosphate synthase [candidate division WOR-3 bacterium]|nr:MAG: pyridoxine 5'-phosphate synthase [candidate division WOR-3 bacterium]